jgi:hypothetical protein
MFVQRNDLPLSVYIIVVIKRDFLLFSFQNEKSKTLVIL